MKFDNDPHVDISMRRMILTLEMHGIESEHNVVVSTNADLAADMRGWDAEGVGLLLGAMADAGHVVVIYPAQITTLRFILQTDAPFVEAVRENVTRYSGQETPRNCPVVRAILQDHFEKRCEKLMGVGQ